MWIKRSNLATNPINLAVVKSHEMEDFLKSMLVQKKGNPVTHVTTTVASSSKNTRTIFIPKVGKTGRSTAF